MMRDMSDKKYSLKELQRDLKRLDRKLENLSGWMEKEGKDKIDYLAKGEISEKLVMPVYIAKRMELYSRYFGNQSKIKVEESE